MSRQGPSLAQLHDNLEKLPKEYRDLIQKELDLINRTRSIKKLRKLGNAYKLEIGQNAGLLEEMIYERVPIISSNNETAYRSLRNERFYPNDVEHEPRTWLTRRQPSRKYRRVRPKNAKEYGRITQRLKRPIKVKFRDNTIQYNQLDNDVATKYKKLKTYNGILKVIDNIIDQKIQRLKDDGVVENEDESAEEAEAEETEEAEAEDTEEDETEEAEAEEVEEEEAEADPRTRTGGNRRKKNKTAKKRPKRRASRTPRRQ